MYSFKGVNPTSLYYSAIHKLITDGDECSPRGKLVKELRPASVEFENPYNRVTFLGSRRVNPFFQIAESLWILSGRADVEWLCQFNANMKSFSDDGVYFNAPYGERIRAWNKNAAHNIIINPVDQLVDAYTKLMSDMDTRQAVIVISNPMFDNSSYTIGESGLDIACNLVITFKIRHNKLNMTVFNRSNDAHWGLWGANLCQFSTIQETMLSWLKHSGSEDLANIEMGEYCQFTDSLHIYLDDYGSKCTTDVFEYYNINSEQEVNADFTCMYEPRMSLNQVQFDEFLTTYWGMIDPYLSDDEYMSNELNVSNLISLICDLNFSEVIDDYWYFSINSMIIYRLVKLGDLKQAMSLLEFLVDCQWKTSMMYFLKTFINKLGRDESRADDHSEIVRIYNKNIKSIQSNLIHSEWSELLEKYLTL